MIKKIACLFAVITVLSCGATAKTASKKEISQNEDAARALVERVTGGRQGEFTIKINPKQIDGKDWFAYYAKDGKVVLEGNNGVSVASALNNYLDRKSVV